VTREPLDVWQCLDEHLSTMDPFVDGLFRHGVCGGAPYQVV
jgi:hypothetical protein